MSATDTEIVQALRSGRLIPEMVGLTQQCATEDKVPVNLAEPAYGMAKGETVCVHIDNIKEAER